MNKKFARIAAFVVALVLSLSCIATALASYSTIPYGEQSNAVRRMQSKLKAKGFYSGSVDGKFGPSTKAAVKKFQNSIGITADGKPGNKTLTALYEGVSAINTRRDSDAKAQAKPTNPRTLYYGCTGSRVKELQRALSKAGVYKGAIDGVYGDLTLAAVKKYQSRHGLHADGMAGVKTLASLNMSTGSKVSTSMFLDVGSKGEEVKSVTRRLKQWGYLSAASDTYTSAVKDAVKAWQTDTGRTATGTFTESQYNDLILN